MTLFKAFPTKRRNSFSIEGRTYRRKLLVGECWVTYAIDLWVKVWYNFFWAHRVHLESQVCNHVEVLTFWRHLGHRRQKRGLKKAVEVQCQVLQTFGQLTWSLLLSSHLSSFCLRSTQSLHLQLKLRLHRLKVALVDCGAGNSNTGPEQRKSTCIEVIKG